MDYNGIVVLMLNFILEYKVTFNYLKNKLMKILMVSTEHNDKVMAVLAFKDLNVANSIDFISTIDELIDYLTIRTYAKINLPDLVLVDLDTNRIEVNQELLANAKEAGLNVITFSTHSYSNKNLYLNTMPEQPERQSYTDELDWILKEVCYGLQTKEGWQYSICPAVPAIPN